MVAGHVEDVKEKVLCGGWNFDDMFREFDEMRKEAERAFSEQFKNIENKVQKI